MSGDICSIEQCTTSAERRGWCKVHWQRWYRHGDPLGGARRYRTPEESFAARTEWQGECLVWTGAQNGRGYGQMRVDGRPAKAHRYAWERVNGVIPEGMYVDHLCHNRLCVNVVHLRLCRNAENISYRAGANSNSKSGIRGVYQRPNGHWVATVKCRGVIHRKTFRDLEEAAEWVSRERVELFGEFAGAA